MVLEHTVEVYPTTHVLTITCVSYKSTEMAWRYWHEDILPFMAMVASECLNVGLNIIFKAATQRGMNRYVFVVYSYAISTLSLLPLIILFRSTAVLPPSKFPLLSKICLLGLIGSVAMLLAYKGIECTSPTLASAMSNLNPAFTFILAVLLRMERLALRSFTTQAKVIGTVVSISGALLVVLYKGPTVLSTSSPSPSVLVQLPFGSLQSQWVLGGLLLATEYLLLSICNILQAQIVKIYPAELTVAFWYNLCATIIAAPICFLVESDLRAWSLGSKLAVVAVFYSGLLSTCLGTVIQLWCLHMKGPLYVTAFKPLSIAIAAFMSFIFLGDALHLGSVVGAIIISIGFFAVMWGKTKEQREDSAVDGHDFGSLESCSDSMTPLLYANEIQHK